MVDHTLKQSRLRKHETLYNFRPSSAAVFETTTFSFHLIILFRKQRPAHVTPVQRIVLNPVLEQSIIENAPSPRATISQKIKVMSLLM